MGICMVGSGGAEGSPSLRMDWKTWPELVWLGDSTASALEVLVTAALVVVEVWKAVALAWEIQCWRILVHLDMVEQSEDRRRGQGSRSHM